MPHTDSLHVTSLAAMLAELQQNNFMAAISLCIESQVIPCKPPRMFSIHQAQLKRMARHDQESF